MIMSFERSLEIFISVDQGIMWKPSHLFEGVDSWVLVKGRVTKTFFLFFWQIQCNLKMELEHYKKTLPAQRLGRQQLNIQNLMVLSTSECEQWYTPFVLVKKGVSLYFLILPVSIEKYPDQRTNRPIRE